MKLFVSWPEEVCRGVATYSKYALLGKAKAKLKNSFSQLSSNLYTMCCAFIYIINKALQK